MKNSLPKFIQESNYSQTKLQELLSGEISRNIDSLGTMSFNLNDANSETKMGEHFLYVPMEKLNIIEEQVETYTATEVIEYAADVEVIEEVDIETDEELLSIEDEISEAISNEQLMQTQIDELGMKLDEEMAKNVKFREDSAEMYLAAKDTIITQRINAGEGNSANDFHDVFPFLPKTSEEKEKQAEKIESFPFMGT